MTEVLDCCTGCGDEAWACIVANGDPDDCFNGPYALCQAAYAEWLKIGHDIVLLHD
jgi:hypothetical protein